MPVVDRFAEGTTMTGTLHSIGNVPFQKPGIVLDSGGVVLLHCAQSTADTLLRFQGKRIRVELGACHDGASGPEYDVRRYEFETVQHTLSR